MRKYLTLKLKKPLSDLYRGQLVEPKSLNKNEQPPLAKPTKVLGDETSVRVRDSPLT